MNLKELAEVLFLPVVATIFALTAFQPIQDRMAAGRIPAARHAATPAWAEKNPAPGARAAPGAVPAATRISR